MNKLLGLAVVKLIKKKDKNFNITSRQLGNVIRDNNRTRKRTRHEHFPITRYGKVISKEKELHNFYKEVNKYKKHLNIIENTGSNRKKYVKDAIIDSGGINIYFLFIHKTNPIEMFFNQIKHFLKLNKKILRFKELNKDIGRAIKQIIVF